MKSNAKAAAENVWNNLSNSLCTVSVNLCNLGLG